MIVLDASVVVELLMNSRLSGVIREELAAYEGSFLAPHLIEVEVVSAIRGMTAGKAVDTHRTRQMPIALAILPVERYAHTLLMDRVWELRRNFPACDAVYIA